MPDVPQGLSNIPTCPELDLNHGQWLETANRLWQCLRPLGFGAGPYTMFLSPGDSKKAIQLVRNSQTSLFPLITSNLTRIYENGSCSAYRFYQFSQCGQWPEAPSQCAEQILRSSCHHVVQNKMKHILTFQQSHSDITNMSQEFISSYLDKHIPKVKHDVNTTY